MAVTLFFCFKISKSSLSGGLLMYDHHWRWQVSFELKCCDSILAVCNTVFWVAVWWMPILYHGLNFHVRIDMVGLWRVKAEKVLCSWYYSFFQSVRSFDIKFAPCWWHPCPPVERYVSHILTRGAKGNSRTYANLLWYEVILVSP